jgi:hypothetical protein
MTDDMNKAQQEMTAKKKEWDEIEGKSVKLLRYARLYMFMDKIVLGAETLLLIVSVIIVNTFLIGVFANQSFPPVSGLWYFSIEGGLILTTVWLGYMAWGILAIQAKKRRVELRKYQQEAEAIYTKIIELRKNEETLIQMQEALT